MWTPWGLGHSLTVAFNRKYNQYGEACFNKGITFALPPVETFGGWHNAAADSIIRLDKALGRNTVKDEGDTTRHLFQRLSVLLVKGNVSLKTESQTFQELRLMG